MASPKVVRNMDRGLCYSRQNTEPAFPDGLGATDMPGSNPADWQCQNPGEKSGLAVPELGLGHPPLWPPFPG